MIKNNIRDQICIAECSFDDALNSFRDLLLTNHNNIIVERMKISHLNKHWINDGDMFYIIPISSHLNRVILYSKWRDGGISTYLNWLNVAKKSGFFISMDISHEDPGLFQFIQIVNGERVRMIRILKNDNGRWEFYEKGSRLPFEIDYEKIRKVKDKLTNEIIINYLNNSGVNFQNEIETTITNPDSDVYCLSTKWAEFQMPDELWGGIKLSQG